MKLHFAMFAVLAVAPVHLGAQTRPEPAPPIMIAPPAPNVRPPVTYPATTFQVEVLGGSEQLWAGQLRVGNTASYSATAYEAPETCSTDKSNLGRYAPNSSRMFRVSIRRPGNSASAREGENRFAVSASWTRPTAPCEEAGSSNVSFERALVLAVGGKAEVIGDGGLTLRLTRVK